MNRRSMLAPALALAVACCTACSADGSGLEEAAFDGGTVLVDAQASDGGRVTGGGEDGAVEPVDASVSDGAPSAADGGSSPDGGPLVDAAGAPDAGPPDAGPPDAGPPTPMRIYLAPDGDDARDGSSLTRAVRTLERAHAILVERAPSREVEIRIAPGTYHGQQVRWTFTMPEHRIRLMPLNDDRVRPVFDGCLPDGSCPGGTWLRLRSSSGDATNLHFEYIQVQRYQTAISLDGNRNVTGGSNGHNRIYGCFFSQIGNVYDGAVDPSTAAVRLVNSDDNEIANTHFVDVINTRSGGLIHAIYVAHLSERNLITRNRFARSTGDPVRLRDNSNDNRILDNRFIRVGTTAGYTDWYCDHDVRTDCTKVGPECPSWGNQFRDNLLDGSWSCEPLGTWHLFQDDHTTGCAPPSTDARRVRTSGNERTATPCSTE